MIDIVLIVLFTYLLVLTEKQNTVNLGGERAAFCSIDLCKEKKLYAPFKYRPLVFWIARLCSITSKNIKSMMIWGERYSYNIYLLNSSGVEKYYIFKYFLFLLANLSFYWYLVSMSLPALSGVLLLDLFLALTFIYDCLDYILETAFYALLMVFLINGYNPILLFIVALLGSLNRESSIFMIPLTFFYSTNAVIDTILVLSGFLIGFVIPRILYRAPSDRYDAMYSSGFKFLTFNPIKNWKSSIWPPLKQRFLGLDSDFFIKYSGVEMKPVINGRAITTHTKEIFLNRIFLGVVFIVFLITVMLYGYFNLDSFYKPMSIIMTLFVLAVTIPADIREIRVYCPAFIILIPYLLTI